MVDRTSESESSVGSQIRDFINDIVADQEPFPEDALDAQLIGQSSARYTLVALIGKGGMGRVYEADDKELGRRVAIKFLPVSAAGKKTRMDRFLLELQVTAGLEHPGIIPVYDSGLWANGQPFYVMRKVAGAPFGKLLARATSLSERLMLLSNLLAVADAVGFAHHHGVVHRDLKPANILVASFGETLVADWGLAKRIRDPDLVASGASADPSMSEEMTSAGVVLGTPAYMAPEQRAAKPADERCDVYAIGVMLHELVYGRRPGRPVGDSGSSGQGPERSALRLERGLLDVSAIIEKATAEDPRDRYANATELADELRRFRVGQLVAARRYTRTDLLLRWLSQHRAVVALGAVLGSALLIVAVASLLRIVRERDAATSARHEAEQARRQTASHNDALVLLQARAQLAQDPTASIAWLETYPVTSPDWKAVSEIAADAYSRGLSRHVWTGKEPFVTRGLAFSPDGATLAAGSRDKGLYLFQVATGTQRWFDSDIELGGPVVFSPDGRWVVSSDGANAVRAWNLTTAERRAIGPMSSARLSFTADGTFLLGAGWTRGADVCRFGTGEVRALGAEGSATAAMILPDDKAAVIVDGRLVLEDLDRGERQDLGRVPGSWVRGSIDASRDGRYIAVGGIREVIVYDRTRGAFRELKAEDYSTRDVHFSPEGDLLSFDVDPRMLRWNLEKGTATPVKVPDTPRALVWPPLGGLVVGGADGHVTVFGDLGEPSRELSGHRAAVNALALSPSGTMVASAGADRTVRVWHMGEGEKRVFHHTTAVRYSDDGRLLLAARAGDWAVELFDLVSGGAPEMLTGPRPYSWSASGTLSPDGRVVVYSDQGQRVTLYDRETHERRSFPYGSKASLDLVEAFSPDGKWLALGTNEGVVEIAPAATGEFKILGRHDAALSGMAFSPDQKTLVTSGRDRLIKLWDVSGQSEPRIFRGHSAEVFDVKFSNDGKRLVSSSADGTLRLWNIDGAEPLVLRGHRGGVDSGYFSPDGKTVLSGGSDRTVRLWDALTGEGRILRRSTEEVWAVAFSPDGHDMLTSGSSTVVEDPWLTPAFETDASRLLAWMKRETTAEVDVSGAVASPVMR